MLPLDFMSGFLEIVRSLLDFDGIIKKLIEIDFGHRVIFLQNHNDETIYL